MLLYQILAGALFVISFNIDSTTAVSFPSSINSLDCLTLCNCNLSNTVLRLKQGSYAIQNYEGNACTFDSVHNFMLTSNVGTATVTCVGSAGLIFMNSVNISISNIVFRNCGGMVDTADAHMSSQTKHLLNNNHLLVVSLMYIDCQNISLQQVSILEYNGFGVLIINTMNIIDIDSLTVSKSATTTSDNPRWEEKTREIDHLLLLKRSERGTNYIANSCTGVTLIFDKCCVISTNILINNSVFILNEHRYNRNNAISSGLSIIATHNISCSILKIRIYNTHFNSNVGTSSSIYVKGSGITVLFKQCSFSNNYGGSGVNVWISNTNDRHVDIAFVNCVFRNHTNVDEGGALSVRTDEFSPCKIVLRNVTCNENTATINGHCAFIHCRGEKYHCMESLNIILENVHARNNGKQLISVAKGIFAFNGATVYIKGNDCLFMDNIDSALMGTDCDVYFNGNSRFINNQALSGGAMHFIDSFANFNEGVVALFEANVATIKGGAIYMYAKNTNLCSLQFHFNQKFNFSSSSSIDITLHFIENKALIDAHSIYAYPVYNCYQRKDSNFIIDSSHMPIFYKQLLHNHHVTVLSIPEVVWLCNNSIRSINDTVSVYPRKFFTIELILLDGNNNSVYGEVYLIFNNSWSIPYDQRVQPILPGKCNLIYLNVLSYATKAHGTLSIQSRESMASTKILLFMEDCPHGLVLLNNTCVCHPLLSAHHGISCDAEKGLINVPIGTWVGLIDGNELAISNSSSMYHSGVGIDVTTIIPVGNLSSCIDNREGVLCGRCKPGYSVIFGTNKCQICSNYWLFTIVGFSLLGIALIVVLFKLKISISTGWFNAIVFYANLCSIATGNFSIDEIPYPVVKGFVVWLSFLNLDLGFPLCFYSSMTSTIKAMLQFVFPCYLILLVIGFIIVTRYSTRMSRMTSHFSVQVLATLIFLSYTKIIRAVMVALQFSSFQTENGTVMNVWYGDGNVKYFQDIDHCILCIIAIIVFVGGILPYTVLLTVLPFMYKFKWVNRIRPFLDAHYGPYKDKYQWWFAVRLWVIVITILFVTLLPSYCGYLLLAGVIVMVFYVLIQVWMKPFKNKFVNTLEIVVLSTWIIGATVLLSSFEGQLPLVFDFLFTIIMGGILVGCIFVLFWIIFIAHVFKLFNFSRDLLILGRGKEIYMEFILNRSQESVKKVERSRDSKDWRDDSSDCDNYREPLISDSI